MITKTSSSEILIIAVSWFLCKEKTRTDRNFQRKHKETSMYVYRNRPSEIVMSFVSDFYVRKEPAPVKVYQKSVTEMLIF